MTMIPDPVAETSKQVGVFMRIMENQPLSLALVVMNFALVAFLFYSGTAQLKQRQETTDMIIKWQQGTDQLMANCVSKEVTQLMLENMQKITETLLAAEQKEIQRMQRVIDSLRGVDTSGAKPPEKKDELPQLSTDPNPVVPFK